MPILALLFGLIWGSFLGVVKDRLDDPRSIFWGRSKCVKCKRTLGLIDLVPIISFVFLRGKCRYCKQPIALSHLIVEVLSAGLAIATYIFYGLSASSFILFCSLSFLMLASLSDIENQEVDMAIFAIGMIFAVVFRVMSGYPLQGMIFGPISFALIPFLLYLINREKWMGLGDTFYALWAGILVGFPQSIAMVFVAFFIGAVFGIIKLLSGTTSHRVAFGPFLAVSAIFGVFYSSVILDYLQVFY